MKLISRQLYFDEFPGWFGVTAEWYVHKDEQVSKLVKLPASWRVWESAIIAAHNHPDPASIGVIPERAYFVHRSSSNRYPESEMLGALYASGKDLMLAAIVTGLSDTFVRLLVTGNSKKAVEKLGTFATLLA